MLRYATIRILAVLFCVVGIVSRTAAVASDDVRYSRFIAQTEPLSPQQQRKKFHLPPGFEIQLVAAEPDVAKPINLNFDAAGRLLVSGSVEYPFPAATGKTPRDAIKLLSDTDGDGRYDKVQTFAAGLNIPVGVSPGPGGVLGYSIRRIDRFVDADNDGRADGREALYASFGFRDTHGMPSSFTWWIDGWVYACQGETNVSPVAGNPPVTLSGGGTLRWKPDGSRLEPFARGQVNPFGLCFDPLGNLYSADSHSRPAYLLLRGGWYPGLGKTHDGLGFGPQMMRHYHGSTGIAGIAYYAAEQFPPEYRDTLFIGNPVTGRINHDRLEPHGSTFEAVELPDFLTCDDPWFRPVDVQLGPDGALYIADFYNRIIAHWIVPLSHVRRDRQRGRIWRVVYTGDKHKPHRPGPVPNLLEATLDELVHFLGDPNLLIRTHATHQLVERIGKRSIEPVRRLIAGKSHPRQRAHGLWVLERLGALDESTIRRLAGDSNRTVRVHLMKALSERDDWGTGPNGLAPIVRAGLADADAFVRRAAADALGRHAAEENLLPLLKLWALAPDEDALLIHTLRMALRDNLQSLENGLPTLAGRLHDRPADRKRLADICLGIRDAESAEFLFAYVQSEGGGHRPQVGPPRLGEFLHHAARYLDADSLPKLYAFASTYRQQNDSAQRRVLRSLYRAAQERGGTLPDEITTWSLEAAGKLLAGDDEIDVFTGVELAWDLKLKPLGGQLASLARKDSPHPPLRSLAIDALAAVDETRSYDVVGGILADAAEPIAIRQKAADALGKINSDRSRQLLAAQLRLAPGPLALVIAQHLAHSEAGAGLLLAAVERGTASARLLQDAAVEQRLRMSGTANLDEQLRRLTKDLPAPESRLARLIFERRAGFTAADVNLNRGKAVFEKHCAACHQIGGEGKQVGPALDGAGLRGLDRLLEDVLDPHRNVARNYESSVLVLKNGRVLSGLALEEGEAVVLVDAEGKQHRFAAAEIESRRRSNLSPMPANVAEKIPAADFYHLLAYLLEERKAEPPKEPASREGTRDEG